MDLSDNILLRRQCSNNTKAFADSGKLCNSFDLMMYMGIGVIAIIIAIAIVVLLMLRKKP